MGRRPRTVLREHVRALMAPEAQKTLHELLEKGKKKQKKEK